MVAFSLGFIDIYWYGIFYFVAFLVGYFFLKFLVKKEVFAKSSPVFHKFLTASYEDVLIVVLIGVIVGGRLGHVFIYDFSYFVEHPLKVFALQEGGMSFIGGILGVVVSLLVFFWKKKLSFEILFRLLDVLVVPVAFGIALGRIGNFLNQELYGIVVPSGFRSIGYVWFSILRDLHIFHVYPLAGDVLRINTNFLASIGEGLLFVVMSIPIVFKWFHGKLFPAGVWGFGFLAWYSMVRFVLEYIRADSQMEYIGWFTKSQWFFILFFVIGLVFVFSFYKKKYVSKK